MNTQLSLPTEIKFMIIKFCSFNTLLNLLKIFELKVYQDEIKKVINFYEYGQREYWVNLYFSALKRKLGSDTENYEYGLYIDYGKLSPNKNLIPMINDDKQLQYSLNENKIEKIFIKNKLFLNNIEDNYKTWDVVCTNRKTFFTRKYFVTD